MKKFLAILLIAIIACSVVSVVVEEEEFDLEKIKIPGWLKKAVKKALDKFKKHGIDKLILDALKKEGRKAGMKLCTKYAEEEVCEKAVDELLKLVK